MQKSNFREKKWRGGQTKCSIYQTTHDMQIMQNTYYTALPMATIQCKNIWNLLSIRGEQGFLFHVGWPKHNIGTGHLNEHFWVNWALILQLSCWFLLLCVVSILLHGFECWNHVQNWDFYFISIDLWQCFKNI